MCYVLQSDSNRNDGADMNNDGADDDAGVRGRGCVFHNTLTFLSKKKKQMRSTAKDTYFNVKGNVLGFTFENSSHVFILLWSISSYQAPDRIHSCFSSWKITD